MTQVKTLSVLIADDSEAYRSGMVRAVRAHEGLDLLLDVDGGLAALAAIEDLRPDLALIDVRMPGLDGLEVCRRVRDLDPVPPTRIVLLSAYMDDDLVAAARAAGAAAYLSKGSSRREICTEAIRVARAPVQ